MFKPGQSGNPNGRTPGTGKVNEYRKLLESHLPELVKVLVDQALAGEPAALRMCFERLIPAYRTESMPVSFQLPVNGNLKETGELVIKLMSEGTISSDQGAQLLSMLSHQAKLVEATDLEKRLSALEQVNNIKTES